MHDCLHPAKLCVSKLLISVSRGTEILVSFQGILLWGDCLFCWVTICRKYSESVVLCPTFGLLHENHKLQRFYG